MIIFPTHLKKTERICNMLTKAGMKPCPNTTHKLLLVVWASKGKGYAMLSSAVNGGLEVKTVEAFSNKSLLRKAIADAVVDHSCNIEWVVDLEKVKLVKYTTKIVATCTIGKHT